MPLTLTKYAVMISIAASIAAFLLVVLTTTVQAQQAYVMHTVQPGEWLFVIARKYCTTAHEIFSMNRSVIGDNPNFVRPGMRLTVRNGCATPQPTNPVTQPTNPVAQPSLAIKTPKPGDPLGSTFIVTGTGAALPQGLVMVKALDAAGNPLAQVTVTLAVPDSTPGREGTWYAPLNVSVPSNSPGMIEVTAPGAAVRAAVIVEYRVTPTPVTGGGGSQGGNVVFYAPGQCQVRLAQNAAVYEYPNGLVKGYVSGAEVTWSRSGLWTIGTQVGIRSRIHTRCPI